MSRFSVDATVHGATSISIATRLVQNDNGDPPFYSTRIRIEGGDGDRTEIEVFGERGGDPVPLTVNQEN